jgi:hypothetical protein
VNAAEIGQYITTTFQGVDVVDASGDSFFFYNPDPTVAPDHRFPIVTLVTGDRYDQFSKLDRPDVFRLNIGVGKETFRARFGTPHLPAEPGAAEGDSPESEYDFTALDRVMPHPVYGRMYWVCVLNPSEQTFATDVEPLLAEAYERAVSKHNKERSRSS